MYVRENEVIDMVDLATAQGLLTGAYAIVPV